jgi:hypothetical protein
MLCTMMFLQLAAAALLIAPKTVMVQANNYEYWGATPTPMERYYFGLCEPSIYTLAYSPDEIPSWTEAAAPLSLIGPLQTPERQSYFCDHGTWAARIDAKYRMIQSQGTLAKFQQEFTNAGGLSIAVRAESGRSGRTAPILTLGRSLRDQSDTDIESSPTQGCPGYYFRLQQTIDWMKMGVFFTLSFTDQDSKCQTVVLSENAFVLQPYHFVVSFGESSTQVYIDGRLMTARTLEERDLFGSTVDVRNWTDAASSTLQLFASYLEGDIFSGKLEQVDLFRDALTAEQVGSLYVRGPGNRKDMNIVETMPPVVVPVDPNEEDKATYNPWYNVTDREDIVAESVVIPQGTMHYVYIELPLDQPSTASVPLGIEITAISGEFHAHRYENGTGNHSLVELNEVLLVGENETGVTLLYGLNADESLDFNSPKFNAYGTLLEGRNESIVFRTVRIGTNYSSPTTVIPIERTHMNHGLPNLTVPTTATLNATEPLQATVHGITVVDHALDFNINRVRVDVWSNGGTISLNPLYLDMADFSCPNRTQIVSEDAEIDDTWQCMGDGHENQRMTFVAIPDDITFILDTMRHETFREFAGQASEVVIRIFDGVDGQCLTDAEHRSYFPYASAYYAESAPEQCLMQYATIFVPGYDIHVNATQGNATQGNNTEHEDPSENMDPATEDPIENSTATKDPQSEEPTTDDPDPDNTESGNVDERTILGMKWHEFILGLGCVMLTVVATTICCCFCLQLPPGNKTAKAMPKPSKSVTTDAV